MNDTTIILCWTAATIGVVHTLLGPDHYLPFVAMSRAGKWSMPKTLAVTAACGLGHVLGSVVLGMIGMVVGTALLRLEQIEEMRGQFAGWLLLAFGLAYLAWGVLAAIRNRPHVHGHVHADGTYHVHEHAHDAAHRHVHASANEPRATPTTVTPWVLFTIFVFGPCEPLIPLLLVPAATANPAGVFIVLFVFAAATLTTMLGVVWLSCQWASAVPWRLPVRYHHAVAGLVLSLSGAAVTYGL